MTNYKVTYGYDGYKFWDVVQAENAEQAKAYLEWIDKEGMKKAIKSEETDEIASYYCPEGWTRPESQAEAERRSYYTWREAYIGKFMTNGRLVETDELRNFLEADGWTRHEEEDEDGFTDVTYTRADKEIWF